MFCKTCGKLLTPKKTPYGKWLACSEGHPQPELNQKSRDISTKNIDKEKRTEVVEKDVSLAVYDHICKKCGYGKAELIEIQPFYSDEDSLVRMKCGKCGFVERLEGKVT